METFLETLAVGSSSQACLTTCQTIEPRGSVVLRTPGPVLSQRTDVGRIGRPSRTKAEPAFPDALSQPRCRRCDSRSSLRSRVAGTGLLAAKMAPHAYGARSSFGTGSQR